MRPNKAYTIRMFAVNSEGLSEPSNVVTVSTKESGEAMRTIPLGCCLAVHYAHINLCWCFLFFMIG